jgi:hypothetical protein
MNYILHFYLNQNIYNINHKVRKDESYYELVSSFMKT